jgi:hypothetical protein
MFYADVVRVLTSGEAVSREDIRKWIDSGDLLTWSAVYALLELPSTQFPAEEAAEFMRRYLIRCIEENPSPGDYIHGGYEAAWELAAALKEWRRRGGRIAASIRGIAVELEKLYRRGDPATRNRVLCGVLEHAFEEAALRPYFANWDRDAELREAYNLAMDWGAAHEE